MQRFFSRFPDGRPGVGLLILRTVATLTAIHHGLAPLAAAVASPLDGLSGVLSIASGLAVLIGLFTRGSALILAATVAWFWLPVHSPAPLRDATTMLLIVADAVAISLLGPGAFSIDARLFGPREIVISRAPRAPRA